MPRRVSYRRVSVNIRWRFRRFGAPVAVVIGGFVGSAARAFAVVVGPSEQDFPVTILFVNLAGAAILGYYLARRQRAVTRRWSLQLIAIGMLGSFTTFSVFSFEVFRMIDLGDVAIAVVYVAVSTVGGLAAALVGKGLGRAL